MTWTLDDRFFEMRDPKLLPASEFVLPNGEKYDNPRGLPEKWLKAYLTRHPQLLAIDVIRAWDITAKIKRQQRWQNRVAIINFVTAVLSLILILAKFFR